MFTYTGDVWRIIVITNAFIIKTWCGWVAFKVVFFPLQVNWFQSSCFMWKDSVSIMQSCHSTPCNANRIWICYKDWMSPRMAWAKDNISHLWDCHEIKTDAGRHAMDSPPSPDPWSVDLTNFYHLPPNKSSVFCTYSLNVIITVNGKTLILSAPWSPKHSNDYFALQVFGVCLHF